MRGLTLAENKKEKQLKGQPGDRDLTHTDRRGFLRLGSYVVGGAAALSIVGCGSEPCPETNVTDPTDAETTPDPVEVNTMMGADCDVDFPEGFKCDSSSESGMKHTPVISAYDDAGETYEFTVVVPHVVNADHHILGCQVVAYIPGALTPHNWIDFHYLTSDYIRTADDSEWSHSFSISKELINPATTHLMIFSLCNKHGAHGETTALAE
jgi:desulfoferrodoxin (superoxide reductase-like protein)